MNRQFQYNEVAYPGVVIEFSCLRRPKGPRKLAEEYIRHSNSNIKAVAGLGVGCDNHPEIVAKEARV